MAASSWGALRLVAVKPHMRVVTATTGPSKQEAEGGGGGKVGGRGGALTKAPSTLGFWPAGGVGLEPGGLKMGLGPGAGAATTVAEGLVGVIGVGDATGDGVVDGLPGDGADTGGCTGAGAGAGGAVHDLEGPVGSLQVSVHCDDFTRLTVEACTRLCPHRHRPRSASRSVQDPLDMSWYRGADIVKVSAQSSPQPDSAELGSEQVYCTSAHAVAED